jgi:hypothetical protein
LCASGLSLADNYVVVMKDESGTKVGAGSFTHNPPAPTGATETITVSFDAGLAFSGDVTVTSVAAHSGEEGQCTKFNKEGECIECNVSPLTDPACQKSINEGGGPSRVRLLVSRPLPETNEGSERLSFLGGSQETSTGPWTMTNAPAGLESGTYFVYNMDSISVPEPPIALLLLAGGIPLAVFARRRLRRQS